MYSTVGAQAMANGSSTSGQAGCRTSDQGVTVTCITFPSSSADGSSTDCNAYPISDAGCDSRSSDDSSGHNNSSYSGTESDNWTEVASNANCSQGGIIKRQNAQSHRPSTNILLASTSGQAQGITGQSESAVSFVCSRHSNTSTSPHGQENPLETASRLQSAFRQLHVQATCGLPPPPLPPPLFSVPDPISRGPPRTCACWQTGTCRTAPCSIPWLCSSRMQIRNLGFFRDADSRPSAMVTAVTATTAAAVAAKTVKHTPLGDAMLVEPTVTAVKPFTAEQAALAVRPAPSEPCRTKGTMARNSSASRTNHLKVEAVHLSTAAAPIDSTMAACDPSGLRPVAATSKIRSQGSCSTVKDISNSTTINRDGLRSGLVQQRCQALLRKAECRGREGDRPCIAVKPTPLTYAADPAAQLEETIGSWVTAAQQANGGGGAFAAKSSCSYVGCLSTTDNERAPSSPFNAPPAPMSLDLTACRPHSAVSAHSTSVFPSPPTLLSAAADLLVSSDPNAGDNMSYSNPVFEATLDPTLDTKPNPIFEPEPTSDFKELRLSSPRNMHTGSMSTSAQSPLPEVPSLASSHHPVTVERPALSPVSLSPAAAQQAPAEAKVVHLVLHLEGDQEAKPEVVVVAEKGLREASLVGEPAALLNIPMGPAGMNGLVPEVVVEAPDVRGANVGEGVVSSCLHAENCNEDVEATTRPASRHAEGGDCCGDVGQEPSAESSQLLEVRDGAAAATTAAVPAPAVLPAADCGVVGDCDSSGDEMFLPVVPWEQAQARRRAALSGKRWGELVSSRVMGSSGSEPMLPLMPLLRAATLPCRVGLRPAGEDVRVVRE